MHLYMALKVNLQMASGLSFVYQFIGNYYPELDRLGLHAQLPSGTLDPALDPTASLKGHFGQTLKGRN